MVGAAVKTPVLPILSSPKQGAEEPQKMQLRLNEIAARMLGENNLESVYCMSSHFKDSLGGTKKR